MNDIRMNRDESGSARLIAQLQQSAYARAGEPLPHNPDPESWVKIVHKVYNKQYPDPVDKKHKESWLKEMIEPYLEAYERRPTDYEDLLKYQKIVRTVDSLRLVVADKEPLVDYWPLIATMPSGSVNAITYRVPRSNESIIIFESELLDFIERLCTVVSMTLAFERAEDKWGFSFRENDIIRMIDANREIVSAFLELLVAYVVHRQPSRAALYDSGNFVSRSMADILRDATNCFILGHEYAHILLGHMRNESIASRRIMMLDADEVIYGWQLEHAADFWGLRLAIEAGDRVSKWGVELSYAGAELFFGALDVMDRATSLLSSGDESAQRLGFGSHPPPALRREVLRAAIKEMISENLASGALVFGQGIEFIMQELWRATKHAVIDERTRGVGVASSWAGPLF